MSYGKVEKGKTPEEFELNNMKFYNEAKKNYKDRLHFLSMFSSEWAKVQQIKNCKILYDETVNSLFTLKSRSKRAGKFDQHTYLVCLHTELGYGYMFNTKKHFQKTNRNDLERFMKLVKSKDSNFDSSWVKDARTWGSSAQVEGMLETDVKYYTQPIERLFGWVKNEVYKISRKTIKEQDQLEDIYKKAFAKYGIIELFIN